MYDQGQTAYQALSSADYRFLSRTHKWRIDKWNREKCISWSLTLLLRHGESYERSGQYTDQHRADSVPIAADGFAAVEDLCRFRLLTALGAGPEVLGYVMRSTNTGQKIRFKERLTNGVLTHIGAAQGHSQKVATILDESQALERVQKHQVPRVCIHGTKMEYVASIRARGIYPGGDRGIEYRQHIHCVETVHGVGETAGVRGGSEALVQILMHDLMDAGAEVYKSANGVFLTSGLWEGRQCLGIAPSYLNDIIDVYTGESVTAFPLQRIERNGRPEGAREEVMQVIVSQEEAERLRGRVGFTAEQEASDRAAYEERERTRINTRRISYGKGPLEGKGNPTRPCAPSPEPAAGASGPSSSSAAEVVQPKRLPSRRGPKNCMEVQAASAGSQPKAPKLMAVAAASKAPSGTVLPFSIPTLLKPKPKQVCGPPLSSVGDAACAHLPMLGRIEYSINKHKRERPERIWDLLQVKSTSSNHLRGLKRHCRRRKQTTSPEFMMALPTRVLQVRQELDQAKCRQNRYR
jgi:RNA:NAD 2'-phosphotransferase (TPT1/KptA family)